RPPRRDRLRIRAPARARARARAEARRPTRPRATAPARRRTRRRRSGRARGQRYPWPGGGNLLPTWGKPCFPHELPSASPRHHRLCVPLGRRSRPSAAGRSDETTRKQSLRALRYLMEANYSSGDDYVVEFLGYRFSFNDCDFEQRVVAAAVKLGLISSNEL